MAERPRAVAKGTFRFEHEGRTRELELELLSDERFRVVEPARKSAPERPRRLFQPARQLPAAVAHEALANVVRRRLEEGRGA